MTDKTKKTALEALNGEESAATPARSGEEPGGRIDRIVMETRQLSDDLSEWFNLRMRLVQLDIQERIDEELDHVFSGVLIISMIVASLLLASFALAFFLGEVLGNMSYGFGIMAAFFVIAAAVVTRIRPRLASGFRSDLGEQKTKGPNEPTKTE